MNGGFGLPVVPLATHCSAQNLHGAHRILTPLYHTEEEPPCLPLLAVHHAPLGKLGQEEFEVDSQGTHLDVLSGLQSPG